MTKSSQRQPTRMRRKVPSRLSCAKFYISSCKGCSPAAAVGTFSASANKKPERKAEATHGSCTEIKSNLFAVESSNMNILQASRRRRRLCRWLLTFTVRPGGVVGGDAREATIILCQFSFPPIEWGLQFYEIRGNSQKEPETLNL